MENMIYTDLHLHLDGSLPYETIKKLAKNQQINLPEDKDLYRVFSVSDNCQSLNEYLEKFELPLELLQNREAIKLSIVGIAKKLTEGKVKYAEIRFAPQLHMKKGLSQKEIVLAAIEGVEEAKKDESIKTTIRLILCMMRGSDNRKENIDTIEAFKEINNNILVGLDLAGAEGLYPTEMFEEEFKLAKSYGIPFTIHAGEAAGAESIWTALRFGAKRIGHGISAIYDEKLMDYLRDNKIAVEVCPSSNLQTKAVKAIKEHPVRKFLQHGIMVTINTDNMTVSNTTIEKEFELLEKELGLTEKEKQKLMKNAEDASGLQK